MVLFPPRGDGTKHVHEDMSCTPTQSLAQIQSQILYADSTFDRLPGAVMAKSLDQSWPQKERKKYRGREREKERGLQSGSEAEERGGRGGGGKVTQGLPSDNRFKMLQQSTAAFAVLPLMFICRMNLQNVQVSSAHKSAQASRIERKGHSDMKTV